MKLPVPASILLPVAILAVFFGPAAALVWPQINWDMLAYIGILKSWSLSDPAAIQHAAFADGLAFAHTMHNDAVGTALASGSAYRRLMSSDPAAFMESFGFYRIRPFYEVLLAAVSRLTPTIAQATVLISAAATCAANIAILVFARRRVGPALGALLALGFALSPVMMTVAGYSTADALGTLVVLLGILAMLSGRPVMGAAILMAAVGVRSDFMLMNATLLLVLAASRLRGWWSIPLPGLALLAASILLARGIEAWAGNYGYHVLYYNTFVQTLLHPAHPGPMIIPPARWITAIVNGVANGMANGAFSMPLLVGLILLPLLPADRIDAPAVLFAALFLSLAARVVLFPSADVRLSAPIFAALYAVLVQAFGNFLRGSGSDAGAGDIVTRVLHVLPERRRARQPARLMR